jgi:diaminohydroxyphosphoribosylaminopyrimidine deaminase/5-amino-6-(5-phosphoribosylamino)uracil reductase
MRAALGLARRGLGRVWPNPAVGCIVTSGDLVVGRGWTGPGGRPHAETIALAQAGAASRGATAYVTLEPCAHTGRTPPCTDALIAAGIARVVIPMIDPDPRVSGRGIAALQAAGIPVEIGCLSEDAAAVNRGFLTRVTAGRPMLTLKLATSLDGRIATRTGESRWITGPEARAEVHLLRAQSDAVMIGAGTARSDDPRLDVRGIDLEGITPVRIVVAGTLDLPLTSNLGRTAGTAPLWLCHHADAPRARHAAWIEAGAELIEVPSDSEKRLDLRALVGELGKRGLTRILCEGGGQLAAALLSADLVDTIVTYTAGIAIGAEGVPVVGRLNTDALADARRFRLAGVERVGADLRTTWSRNDSSHSA